MVGAGCESAWLPRGRSIDVCGYGLDARDRVPAAIKPGPEPNLDKAKNRC